MPTNEEELLEALNEAFGVLAEIQASKTIPTDLTIVVNSMDDFLGQRKYADVLIARQNSIMEFLKECLGAAPNKTMDVATLGATASAQIGCRRHTVLALLVFMTRKNIVKMKGGVTVTLVT